MKTFELPAYGVDKITKKQIKSVNGGSGLLLGVIIGLLVGELFNENRGKDMQDGYNDARGNR